MCPLYPKISHEKGIFHVLQSHWIVNFLILIYNILINNSYDDRQLLEKFFKIIIVILNLCTTINYLYIFMPKKSIFKIIPIPARSGNPTEQGRRGTPRANPILVPIPNPCHGGNSFPIPAPWVGMATGWGGGRGPSSISITGEILPPSLCPEPPRM